MHIPDGYLSPATCAVMYGAAAPFWYVASQKVKKALSHRMVPLLAVFSAFAFVIQMFNIPVPDGTTAHATGAALMAIVLGPWAAVLGVSVALFIQAVFFGDGGILAFGANAFNMAVVIPLVAYTIYRALAGRAPVGSSRQWIAAAVAGYVAINVAALAAAVEFGIQPALFRAADGTPLYSPYGLSVAVPAMMFAHLTIAGFAEAVVTGGAVAFLQRAMPHLWQAEAVETEAAA
jgi:cobalt/nickel transport system permease protein